MARRVLVTGAAGNIGSAVMHDLADAFELTGLDIAASPGIAQVDIADFDALLPHAAGVDAIVHLGADPNPSASWASVLHNNLVGTRNVYEAATVQGVRRVVFASSHQSTLGWESDEPWASVLAGAPGPPDFRPFDATTPFRPSGDYGASKAWGEVHGRVYSEHHGLSVICLRIVHCTPDNRPPAPFPARWLSRGDAARAIGAAITAPDDLRFGVYYIVSDNANMIFDREPARRDLGFVAQDGWR
jgi:NAD+ dependent glucose-6-phosphate dehydrogenase